MRLVELTKAHIVHGEEERWEEVVGVRPTEVVYVNPAHIVTIDVWQYDVDIPDVLYLNMAHGEDVKVMAQHRHASAIRMINVAMVEEDQRI